MQTRSTLGSCIVNGRRRSGRFRAATASILAPSSSPSRSNKSSPPPTPPTYAEVTVGGKRKRARSDGDVGERPTEKRQDQKKETPQQKGEEQEKEEQTDHIVEESAVPEEEHVQPSQKTYLLPSPEITEREAEPEGLSEPIYIPAEVDEGTLAHAYDTDDELREEKEIQTLQLNSVKWDRVLENYKDEREEDSDDDETPDEACIPFRRSPAPEPRTPRTPEYTHKGRPAVRINLGVSGR